MFEEYETILNNYEIQMVNSYKGRGAIIIKSENGLKILKRVKLHNERLNYLNDLHNVLWDKGFNIDRIIRNKEDELYTEYDGNRYILKEWVEGREIFFNNSNEIKTSCKILANLHKSTYGAIGKKPYEKYDKTDLLTDTLNRHNRELIRIRNIIRKMGRWSEFDILYLKCFNGYYCDAIKAIKGIDKHYDRLKELYSKNKVIIHGQYNHHNLIYDNSNRLYIVNFECSTYNFPIVDLYSMLRKVLEKNNWDYKLATNVLDNYNSIYSLHNVELKVMMELFKYPEKFWKISNYYLNLNKAWKPKQTLVKLKQLIRQEESKRECIAKLAKYIENW